MNMTTNIQTLPATQGTFLTHHQLRNAAPAIFSKSCDPRVTERYQFVPTFEIMDKLEERGFYPVTAEQNRATKGNPNVNPSWAFHTVRFQHRSNELLANPHDGIIPQVVLVNSHDRTRRLSLMAGFFRLICTNGLIAPLFDENGEELAVSSRRLHTTSLKPMELIDNALLCIDRGAKLIERMQQRTLTVNEQLTLADSALGHVWRDTSKFESSRWLSVRREEDEGDDLWHVFNRVQENVVQGGVVLPSGRQSAALGGGAPATGTQTRVRFNEHLWRTALTLLN